MADLSTEVRRQYLQATTAQTMQENGRSSAAPRIYLDCVLGALVRQPSGPQVYKIERLDVLPGTQILQDHNQTNPQELPEPRVHCPNSKVQTTRTCRNICVGSGRSSMEQRRSIFYMWQPGCRLIERTRGAVNALCLDSGSLDYSRLWSNRAGTVSRSIWAARLCPFSQALRRRISFVS